MRALKERSCGPSNTKYILNGGTRNTHKGNPPPLSPSQGPCTGSQVVANEWQVRHGAECSPRTD
eukprot:1160551-Pelagomonas_calceolata.AAC.8